jgi:hypothetical protein
LGWLDARIMWTDSEVSRFYEKCPEFDRSDIDGDGDMRRPVPSGSAHGTGEYAFCGPVDRAAKRESSSGCPCWPVLQAAAVWTSADGDVHCRAEPDGRLDSRAAFAIPFPIAPSGLLIPPRLICFTFTAVLF